MNYENGLFYISESLQNAIFIISTNLILNINCEVIND